MGSQVSSITCVALTQQQQPLPQMPLPLQELLGKSLKHGTSPSIPKPGDDDDQGRILQQPLHWTLSTSNQFTRNRLRSPLQNAAIGYTLSRGGGAWFRRRCQSRSFASARCLSLSLFPFYHLKLAFCFFSLLTLESRKFTTSSKQLWIPAFIFSFSHYYIHWWSLSLYLENVNTYQMSILRSSDGTRKRRRIAQFTLVVVSTIIVRFASAAAGRNRSGRKKNQWRSPHNTVTTGNTDLVLGDDFQLDPHLCPGAACVRLCCPRTLVLNSRRSCPVRDPYHPTRMLRRTQGWILISKLALKAGLLPERERERDLMMLTRKQLQWPVE